MSGLWKVTLYHYLYTLPAERFPVICDSVVAGECFHARKLCPGVRVQERMFGSLGGATSSVLCTLYTMYTINACLVSADSQSALFCISTEREQWSLHSSLNDTKRDSVVYTLVDTYYQLCTYYIHFTLKVLVLRNWMIFPFLHQIGRS